MTSIVCAVVFCLFSLTYLFFYQDDILTMEQHVLSNGVTCYNRTIGAVILTLLLLLIQAGTDIATRRCTKHPAMTYFIPMMLIAILTDVSPNIDKGYSIGNWAWGAPLLLIVYAIATYMSASLLANNEGPYHKSQFRILWENLSIMAIFMLLTCATSNTDRIFHQRMRIDKLASEGKYAEALAVRQGRTDADSSITMLRAYALSKKGLLGERLFEYPLKGGSDALLPNGTSVKAMICEEKFIFHNVAEVMKQKVRPMKYLRWMRSHGYAKPQSEDYILCGYLLDKDIDAFAKEVSKDPRFLKNQLPKHYREALVLYNHLRSNPIVLYRNAVAEADYTDFQTILRNTPEKESRKALAQDAYGNTYWYYYWYNREQ